MSEPTTTRTVIVTLADDSSANWLTISQILTWHKLPAAVPNPAFPVRHRPWTGWLTRWTTRHLIDPVRRHGGITHAAGGRRSRLDLDQYAATARDQAVVRWRTFDAHIARTTPVAKPWEVFLAEHTKAPDKLALDEALRRFEAQPRVLAMLAHNTYPTRAFDLDPDELAALQAGEAVYVALAWQRVITGDALITPDGRLLQPASTTLADRLRYLGEATRIIHGLGKHHFVIAVKASPVP